MGIDLNPHGDASSNLAVFVEQQLKGNVFRHRLRGSDGGEAVDVGRLVTRSGLVVILDRLHGFWTRRRLTLVEHRHPYQLTARLW